MIHALTHQGQAVHVLTIMAASPPDPPPQTPIVTDIHARWQAGYDPVPVRRQEDETALAICGASAHYGTFPDCIYRQSADGTALYPTEESLSGPVHPSDPVRHASIFPDSLLTQQPVIVAPLAVGQHVDHVLIRDHALTLKRNHPDIVLFFYTDFPYSRDADAIQQARAALSVSLEPHLIPLTQSDIDAKIQAMTAYRTQISTFWQDEQHLAHDVRQRFQQSDGSYAERLWRIIP